MSCGYDVGAHIAREYREKERERAEAEALAEAERRRRHAEAEAQIAEEHRRAEEARRQEAYQVNTGLGRCPRCQSTNITHVRRSETDAGAQAAFAGCMCCCIAWPLALLAPFLFKSRATYGHCNSCGAEWPL